MAKRSNETTVNVSRSALVTLKAYRHITGKTYSEIILEGIAELVLAQNLLAKMATVEDLIAHLDEIRDCAK